ncbi:MAG: 1-deoxy-D-xylulose-5-phosphate reductoisomerase [Chloroflexi bacterium CG_4_9_14_3_um_filter_45_9]|nr:MAG: 1-deoxy-D-xylulose-5-phosphate reductoisomerase [Chloroflexi bacterium CG_4_9_14_3_um_filter_45_9]
MKKIALLGSTGSIGQQVLDVIRFFPDKFEIVGLAGGKNLELLKRQIMEFQPKMFYSSVKPDLILNLIQDEEKFFSMEEMASHPEVDLVIVATSGKAGLSPTLAAIKAGKTVALANKEVLVMAGEIISQEANSHKSQILPIDSEHSAIWQCLLGEKAKPQRLFLTASGGPFYNYSTSQLEKVTVEQALYHPIWRMGRKVTVDSATLMNKGLETIEAHWLFAIPLENIEILIHPQSIVHSLVEFADGSVKAQLSIPDMRLPIQYALTYPQRLHNLELPRLDWNKIEALTFELVDCERFPCLKLALDAGKSGGTYPTVLCAADEVAVELFLAREISFTDIAKMVQKTLEQHKNITQPSLEEILAADAWAREYTTSLSCHRRANLWANKL